MAQSGSRRNDTYDNTGITASRALTLSIDTTVLLLARVDVCSLNQVEYLGVRLISDKAVSEDKGAIPEERWLRLNTSATIYLEALRFFES